MYETHILHVLLIVESFKLINWKQTERNYDDDEIKDGLRTNIMSGISKKEMKSDMLDASGMSQADKDRGIELLNETVDEKLEELLKEISKKPNKYKIENNKIYQIRNNWFDKEVYTFK